MLLAEQDRTRWDTEAIKEGRAGQDSIAPYPRSSHRAVAVAERDGPEAGLALVEAIGGLEAYPWWHATRAELLERIGRTDAARSAYEQARLSG